MENTACINVSADFFFFYINVSCMFMYMCLLLFHYQFNYSIVQKAQSIWFYDFYLSKETNQLINIAKELIKDASIIFLLPKLTLQASIRSINNIYRQAAGASSRQNCRSQALDRKYMNGNSRHQQARVHQEIHSHHLGSFGCGIAFVCR